MSVSWAMEGGDGGGGGGGEEDRKPDVFIPCEQPGDKANRGRETKKSGPATDEKQKGGGVVERNN